MSAAKNFNYLLKFIIIGDPSVGKSNIVLKYANNKFTDDYQATIGVEFGAKNIEINKKSIRIQIWDTAGQENFRSIIRSYYKNCCCAIVTYDITCRKSFESIQNWMEEVKCEAPSTVQMILVGNKCDLENQRAVTKDEGEELAQKEGIIFMETSAKTGVNIDEIFRRAATDICDKIEKNYFDLSSENSGIKVGKVNNNITVEKNNSTSSSTTQLEKNKVIKGNAKTKKKCCQK